MCYAQGVTSTDVVEGRRADPVLSEHRDWELAVGKGPAAEIQVSSSSALGQSTLVLSADFSMGKKAGPASHKL